MSGARNCAEALAAKGTMFKHDMASRVDEAREEQIAEQDAWRKLCAYVNTREDFCCRCCGRRVNPHALSMLQKGHHHHIVYRSAGGPDTKENVCLVCADCHDAEHVKKTLRIEGDAEKALAIHKRGSDGRWYLWRQETAPGVFVECD